MGYSAFDFTKGCNRNILRYAQKYAWHTSDDYLNRASEHLAVEAEVSFNASDGNSSDDLVIPWSAPYVNSTSVHCPAGEPQSPNLELVRALARAHRRMRYLVEGKFRSIDELAKSEKTHSKALRQELRLASLSPDITEPILNGEQPPDLSLSKMLTELPLSWLEQRRLLGFGIPKAGAALGENRK